MIRTYRRLMRSNNSGISSRLYSSFLDRVNQSGGTIPQAVKTISNPLVTSYRDFDFLSIPQFNVADEVWSVKGQNMFVTGGGNGSRFDENGLLVTGLPNNRPRLTFDPLTVDYDGILVERESTNLEIYSNAFEANPSHWTIGQDFVVDNYTTSPEGLNNAAKITEGSSGTFRAIRAIYSSNIPVIQNQQYTVSVLAKKGDGSTSPDFIQIVGNNIVNPGSLSNFDLVNGIVTASFGLENKIKKINNGFFEISISPIPNNDLISAGCNVVFINNDPLAPRIPQYSGLTTSNTFLYGFQFEIGLKTSLIKTNGSELTRPADIYTANCLINTTANHLKFYIKNGIKYAEYYDHSAGTLKTYEAGILISTEGSYTPTADWVISSEGSDTYLLFAYREGTFSETYIQNL